MLAFLGTAASSHADTLVSNLGNGYNQSVLADVRHAQVFETGNHSAGYKLEAVQIRIRKPGGSRGLRVRLYTVWPSSERPNARIFTFPTRDIPSGTNNVRFEAPAGTRLDPGTKYAIEFVHAGGSGSALEVRRTFNSSQTGFDSWSIANEGHFWNGSTWIGESNELVMIAVLGTNADDEPYVADVDRESAPAGGLYETGDTITVSVTFSETVDVTGAPRLPLDIGGTTRHATAAAVMDSTVVDFTYVVQDDDYDEDGFDISESTLELNGGKIKRAGDDTVDADLAHPSVGADSDYSVNTAVIERITMVSEAPHERTYTLGDDIEIGVAFNLPVAASGTPQLAFCLNNSGEDCDTRQADYDRGSGSDTLVFRYTVQADEEDDSGIWIGADAVSLNGGAITLDGDSSRDAVLDNRIQGTQSDHRVNGGTSIIDRGVAVTSSPRAATATYGAGERIEITVTFGAPVNATANTDFVLSVSGPRRAPLLRGSGTKQLVFGYTVASGDRDANGIWIGDQSRTLEGNRDGDPQNGEITSAATDNAATLDHSQLGERSGHKVDGGLAPPSLSVAAASGTEGGDVSFTATLSEAIAADLTATWTASIGITDSAVPADLGATTTAMVTVAEGSTTATFAVATVDDATDEFDKTFTVTLSDPSTAALAADPTATGTILDNDDPPTLAIADATATEGADVEFVATLSEASGKTVRAELEPFIAVGDTASAADFASAVVQLTFDPGETRKTAAVATVDDTLDEDAETFSARGSVPAESLLALSTAKGTINDNDDPPVLSVADATGAEGGTVNFAVELSTASGKDVTVEASTSIDSSDTAEAADFTALSSQTVTIEAGHTSATVPVTAASDTEDDDSETFTLTLSNAVNATFAGGATTLTAAGTIREIPSLRVSDASAAEGAAVSFAVTLSPAASSAVTVNWAASRESGDTAAEGDDFTAASGTLTFAASETTKTVTVATAGDALDEADETFSLTLSNASSNAAVAGAPATGTITDDDDPPELRVADASAAEGGVVSFEVTLSAPSGRTATVEWATSVESGDTAEADDLTTGSGTLTFAAGETRKTVTATTTADADGDDESFTLTLSNAANATFAGGATTLTAAGTITDTPRLDVADAAAVEGDPVSFTVTLSRAAPAAVTVNWRTVAGPGDTAASTDFVAASGTLRFAAGETMKTVTTTTTADLLDEGAAETFTLTLSNASSNAVLEGGEATLTATGTITDDDEPPVLGVADASAAEGDPVSFAVTLSAPSGLRATVRWATSVESGDTAEPDDLVETSASGTLNFAVGDTRKTVTAATTRDADNDDETFTLTLSNPMNATFAGGATSTPLTATGTIADLPRLRVVDATPSDPSAPHATAWEGDAVSFRVELSRIPPGAVTVDWTAAPGPGDTAEADDLAVASGSLTISGPNATRRTVTVPTSHDDDDDETFTLTLSNPVNASFAGGGTTLTAAARIADDEGPAPTVTLVDVQPTESTSGGLARRLELHLSCPDCPEASEATWSSSDPVTGVWFDVVAIPNHDVRFWQRPDDEAAGCAPIVERAAGEILLKQTFLANFGNVDTGHRPLILLVETDVPCNGRPDSFTFAAAEFTLELRPWNRSLQAGPAWVVDTRGGFDEFEIVCPGPDCPTTPRLDVADASADEGTAVSFAVTLSPAASLAVTVNWAASRESGDTAAAGDDFTAASGTLTFAAGDATRRRR